LFFDHEKHETHERRIKNAECESGQERNLARTGLSIRSMFLSLSSSSSSSCLSCFSWFNKRSYPILFGPIVAVRPSARQGGEPAPGSVKRHRLIVIVSLVFGRCLVASAYPSGSEAWVRWPAPGNRRPFRKCAGYGLVGLLVGRWGKSVSVSGRVSRSSDARLSRRQQTELQPFATMTDSCHF
jgi:hypothetical protein